MQIQILERILNLLFFKFHLSYISWLKLVVKLFYVENGDVWKLIYKIIHSRYFLWRFDWFNILFKTFNELSKSPSFTPINIWLFNFLNHLSSYFHFSSSLLIHNFSHSQELFFFKVLSFHFQKHNLSDIHFMSPLEIKKFPHSNPFFIILIFLSALSFSCLPSQPFLLNKSSLIQFSLHFS